MFDATVMDDLTINYVILCLLNEEAHQGITPTAEASSALVAVSPHHGFQHITCYLCQQKGHYQCNSLASPTPTTATATFTNDLFTF